MIEERLICVEQIDEVVAKRRSEPTQRTVRAYSSRKQSPSWRLESPRQQRVLVWQRDTNKCQTRACGDASKVERHIAFNAQGIAKGTPVAQILFYPLGMESEGFMGGLLATAGRPCAIGTSSTGRKWQSYRDADGPEFLRCTNCSVNGQDVAEPTSVLTRILKFSIYT